uniref:Uncharacterized protein n=1 Tax=Anguilla anguilla TaxID=7936 RepID=A0A0E9VYL8_ANGAN
MCRKLLGTIHPIHYIFGAIIPPISKFYFAILHTRILEPEGTFSHIKYQSKTT